MSFAGPQMLILTELPPTPCVVPLDAASVLTTCRVCLDVEAGEYCPGCHGTGTAPLWLNGWFVDAGDRHAFGSYWRLVPSAATEDR